VGQAVDQVMREQGVEQITTGLTGTLPDHREGKLALSDFEMELDPHGNVLRATCPAEKIAEIRRSKSGKSFQLLFPPTHCQECAFFQTGQCPIHVNKKKTRFSLTVPKDRASSSQRRRRFERCKEDARNLRPAVEGTIFQVKHTLRGGKLRVRGLLKVGWAFSCAALAVNLRRIHRFENDRQRGKTTSKKGREAFLDAIWNSLGSWLMPCHRFLLGRCTGFSC
jgi:hypothetical protein